MNFKAKGNHHKIFTNTDCEYFPCHTIEEGTQFNCLFCYCPLYFIPCPGDYKRLDNGLKDCMGCTLPHEGEKSWYLMIEWLDKEHVRQKKIKERNKKCYGQKNIDQID